MSSITIERKFENENKLTNIFISSNQDWKSTENQQLQVLESGSKGILMKQIIEAIHNAKRMICLQSFLIQDTTIIDALINVVEKKKVKVYIMDSAESRLDNLLEEEEDFIAKEYVEMIDKKFKFRFVHRQANNLHAKFILIDPISNPTGFLFTGNFNKKPFYENPELAVVLDTIQVNELFQLFVYHFWNHTTDEQNSSQTFEKIKPVKVVKKPILKNILVTSPDTTLSNLKTTILKAVESAKTSIQFSTFGFDISHEISKVILNKLKNGVAVTIFCRTRKKTIDNHLSLLLENGANIFCHPLIHAKSILIDHKKGFIFTANFEKHGMDQGFEIGVSLKENQIIDLALIYDSWQASFPYHFHHEYPIKDIDAYWQFNKEGKLEKKKLRLEEEKQNNRNIKKVADFTDFFGTFKKPIVFAAKRICIKKTAKFIALKNPIKNEKRLEENLFKITYEKKSIQKKKEVKVKVVAILIRNHSSIDDDSLKKYIDILQVKEFQNLEMYITSEKKQTGLS